MIYFAFIMENKAYITILAKIFSYTHMVYEKGHSYTHMVYDTEKRAYLYCIQKSENLLNIKIGMHTIAGIVTKVHLITGISGTACEVSGRIVANFVSSTVIYCKTAFVYV